LNYCYGIGSSIGDPLSALADQPHIHCDCQTLCPADGYSVVPGAKVSCLCWLWRMLRGNRRESGRNWVLSGSQVMVRYNSSDAPPCESSMFGVGN
jgi:hypothetical protein